MVSEFVGFYCVPIQGQATTLQATVTAVLKRKGVAKKVISVLLWSTTATLMGGRVTKIEFYASFETPRCTSKLD